MDRHTYRTSVRWTGERRGSLASEGLPGITVVTPPQFPGGHEGAWSPEHLFTAAAEACLMTTFLAIAANSKLDFKEYSSVAEGILEKTESGYLMTEIVLRPRVVVAAADQVDRAKRILEKSEKHCLISNSMKSRIVLEAEVVVG
ncbi:MAG: OsmC family protein [Deltaproteobacteria bacterium]|nr:OsmC family protein [Deltaproteobacteria bacterium]